jgi:hypothetical protein
MAMLSFVFIPIFLELLQTRSRGQNVLVVSTSKYGKLYETDLQNLMQQRILVYNFLQRVAEQVASKRGKLDMVQMALAEMGGEPGSDREVVETWLLTRRAKELGLQVTEETVHAFLQDVTAGKVDNAKAREILTALHARYSQLVSALEQELLATRLRSMVGMSLNLSRAGLDGVTPEQRYDCFLRLYRNAKIEAVPVAVEPFIGKVETPSDKDLQALFEKHKEASYDPNSAELGFRKPHRIDLQYFKAEHESFVDLKAISDDAVKAYYEQNKEKLYREKEPLPTLPGGPPSKPEPPKPESSKPESSQPGAPKSETPKSPASKPEAPKPEVPKAEAPKAGKPKEEGATPGAPKAESPKAGDKQGGKTSSTRVGVPLRLVSFAEKAPAASPAPKAAPAPATAKDAPATKDAPAAAKADAAAAKPDPAAGKGATAPAQPPAPKASPAAAKAPEPKKEPPKYVPLEKVRDEIRRHLAEQQATGNMQKLLTGLQDQMVRYHRQRMDYEAMDEARKSKASPPDPLDFPALAKRYGLKTFQTGAISEYEAEELDIGKSFVEKRRFVDYVFAPRVEYQPGLSQDLEGNQYLFWKVSDEPEGVPTWDEPGVREQVLRAWQLLQARELATQQAERLADLARKSPKARKSLKDVTAGSKEYSVISPDPFTWMTFGETLLLGNRPPRLSAVKGVERLGMDFMRSVFALAPGEIGLAWNHPKSIIYVVHQVEYTPPEADLWKQFLNMRADFYLATGQYDGIAIYQAWLKGLQQEADLRWHRPPHEERGRGRR